MIADFPSSTPGVWSLERRNDGAVIVRVASRRDVPAPLPDAVFTFRDGDPQYDFWAQQLARQELE